MREQIDESLKRLQTDVIDLMQMHEINWDNDPEWVVEQGGLAELLKMQKEGKVRFVGFTGHKSPHIHLKMMPVHKWDTVQCRSTCATTSTAASRSRSSRPRRSRAPR